MQKENHSNTARKIVRKTHVEVLYDFSKEKHQRWARRMSKKLTQKDFELEEYEPGKAIFTKETIFDKE